MALLSIPHLDPSRLVPLAVLLLSSAALIGLAFIVAPVLVPGALLLAVIFLLFPLRRNVLISRLMIVAILIVVLWFLIEVSGILLPFIVGMLLVYVINPSVTRLDEHGVRRWLSSLIFVLLLVGGMAALFAFGVPQVVDKLGGIDRGLRAVLHQVTREIESGRALPGVGTVGASPAEAGKAVTHSIGPQASAFALGVLAGILDFFTAFEQLAQHVMDLAVLPFFVFFLLKDLPGLAAWVEGSIPAKRRELFVAVIRRLDDILGRYFRGAIVVAAIQGAISGTGLWLIGVNHPVLLGVMTGFMDFFPYVGLFISLVVSSLVAYAAGGAFLTKVILIAALYLAQKLLEATVLAPKIIGPHVGLHPVLLIMTLILFEYFLGFVGLLIAVPAGAVMMAAAQAWSEAQPPKVIIQSTT